MAISETGTRTGLFRQPFNRWQTIWLRTAAQRTRKHFTWSAREGMTLPLLETAWWARDRALFPNGPNRRYVHHVCYTISNPGSIRGKRWVVRSRVMPRASARPFGDSNGQYRHG